MLDAVGIVHMNGRIYDQKLARFLQADPVIQDLSGGVSHSDLPLVEPSFYGEDGSTHVCR